MTEQGTHMTGKFIIMRKDGEDFQSMGPLACPFSLEEASEKIRSLSARYPYQEFRIFADVGGVIREDGFSLDLHTPHVVLRASAAATPLAKRVRAA